MTQPQAQSADLGSLVSRLVAEAREHKRQEQMHRRAAQECRQQIDALRALLDSIGIKLNGTVTKGQSHDDGTQQR